MNAQRLGMPGNRGPLPANYSTFAALVIQGKNSYIPSRNR